MCNTFIEETRLSCPSPSEPNRTRLYIKAHCHHCGTEYTVKKANYSTKTPCPSCQKRLRGKEGFLQKAEQKFGDKFDLTKTTQEYFDYYTPVTVRCVKHDHEYKIKPVHFVANSYDNAPHKGGCPKCAIEASKKYLNKPITHYLQHLNDKFPDIKVNKLPENTESNLNTIELICPVHGVFIKTLADLVRLHPDTSSLCPHCSKEKLAWRTRQTRVDVPGTVYFVKFTDVDLYKCGVTYKSISERFKGVLSKIQVIWTIELATLEQAYALEVELFRKYKEFRTKYPDNSFGGYTEFLSINVEKPDERFIEEILCRKESNSGKPLPSNVEGNPERKLEKINSTLSSRTL